MSVMCLLDVLLTMSVFPYSGIRQDKNASEQSHHRTTAAHTASASSTTSRTWSRSTTSSSGCRKSIATPPRASTSCSWATRATWRTRRWWSTRSRRYESSLKPCLFFLPCALILIPCGEVGIRRQHRHPLLRDVSEECVKRRTSLLDHGPTDQGEDGHDHGQQQADGASRSRSRRAVGFRGRMLLDSIGRGWRRCRGQRSGQIASVWLGVRAGRWRGVGERRAQMKQTG